MHICMDHIHIKKVLACQSVKTPSNVEKIAKLAVKIYSPFKVNNFGLLYDYVGFFYDSQIQPDTSTQFGLFPLASGRKITT